MSLKDELVKVVIDKTLLLIVSFVVIFVGHSKLEEYRSKQSFVNKINEIKVIKIAEIWEAAAEYEVALEKAESALNFYLGKNNGKYKESFHVLPYESKKTMEVFEYAEQKREMLSVTIRKYRFYLDKEISDEMGHYTLLSSSILNELLIFDKRKEDNPDYKIRESLKKLEHYKKNINSITKYLITEYQLKI